MRSRTLTVKFLGSYEDDSTAEEAVAELRDELQSLIPYRGQGVYDNFVIVAVEEGDANFWSEWKREINEEAVAPLRLPVEDSPERLH